jgi:hypothetical protein
MHVPENHMNLHRRTFLAGALSTGVITMIGPRVEGARATPTADEFPTLTLTLLDDGFEIEPTLAAGRYAVTVRNDGTSADAHTVFAGLPDGVTRERMTEVLQSEDDAGFDFNTLKGAGFPDWPPAGGWVTGVADLHPGTYVLFDPFSSRGYAFVDVTGEMPDVATPDAEYDITIGEMEIIMPDAPFTTEPARWHIANKGALLHEVAVLSVPEGFTFDDFMALMMLPEEATPTPDMPVFEYKPVAAIGLLGSGGETWLDVHLPGPGHYMAVCMFPDDQGMPHAMSGMYAFFDIA